MKIPKNSQHVLFGGTFILANKLQLVGDRYVDGLSTKQWFLLRNLLDLPKEPAPSITEIAQIMNSSRQNITKMLEVLERDGLVRIKTNERDKRTRSVCITPLGQQQASKTAENAQEFLACLFHSIDPIKLDSAAEVLLKMMENLEIMEANLTSLGGKPN